MAQSLTPVKAIRAKCLSCCGDSWHEVQLCTCGCILIGSGGQAEPCPLYPYRFGHRPNAESLEGFEGPSRTPVKAIRAKCLGCAPELAHLGRCGIADCPLYRYRMGRRKAVRVKRGQLAMGWRPQQPRECQHSPSEEIGGEKAMFLRQTVRERPIRA